MKTRNDQKQGTKIFYSEHTHRKLGKGLKENPNVSEITEMHHINLPDDKMIEVWYDDTIAPIEINEYQNKPSINICKRRTFYQVNTFETKPFSEIYNMAVMLDSF